MQRVETRDHSATIAWAERLISDPNTIYLDTETTGLGSDAEIVDIAVIDSSGRVLLDTLVKPVQPIPANATRIHGISNAMVAEAPRWNQVAPRLGRLLTGASGIVIYNADFDTRIMNQCNARFRLAGYRANWQCAMLRYAAYAGHRHERYGGYRWHKLTDAAAAFGYREPVEHRALADTRLCRTVVHGMAGWRAS
ncbi:exonuclease domain-containing protein [soil metagenome]